MENSPMLEMSDSNVGTGSQEGTSGDDEVFISTQGLQRQVNLLGGICLLVGTIIGSGIFASPSSIIENVSSPGAALVIWAGCGVLALFGSLVYVELGTMFPNAAGGEYTYLKAAFGNLPAFLFVFTSSFIIKPSSMAIIAITCGDYIMVAVGGDGKTYGKLIAFILLAVILIINCLSVKWATLMQVTFTAAKMIAVVLLIITGFVRLGQGYDENFKNAFNGTNTRISSIGYAFYGGLWAYGGWNNLNFVTEELKNPIRDLPLAIMIGIPLVTGCYVMINVAYLTVMSAAQISQSNAVAVTLGYDLYGKMAWVIPFLVACSTFGAANGSAFTSGRLVYASAREGHMPKLLAMVHKKRHTPLPALVFTCFIALIMLIPESSNFNSLVNYFSFSAWTFHGAAVAALLWLRIKEPNLKRPYKVFIGIPIVVLLCSIYLVVAPFYDYPKQSSYCLLFILFGIPVYFAFVHFKIFPKRIYDGIDLLTKTIEDYCNLAMPVEEGTKDALDQQKPPAQQKQQQQKGEEEKEALRETNR